jgi:hypothetical protein
MMDFKTMSPERIKELIRDAEQELHHRATVQVEEKKAKVVIAIRELLAACRSAGMWKLDSSICWTCGDCDEDNYFDLVEDDVLADVADVLERKC